MKVSLRKVLFKENNRQHFVRVLFSAWVMVFSIGVCTNSFGQVQLLTDGFGSSSENPITRTGWTGNAASGSAWEIKTTSASSGYSNPNATGGGNAFTTLATNTNTKQLTYDNSLSTVGYQTLNVKFGGIKSGTVPDITVLYSTDGASYLSAGTVTLTNSWALYTVSLPSAAEGASNLRIRFEVVANNSGSNNLRLDDFSVYATSKSLVVYSFESSNLNADASPVAVGSPTLTASAAESYFGGSATSATASACFATSNGKYFELTIATTGYTGITVDWNGRTSSATSSWVITGDDGGGYGGTLSTHSLTTSFAAGGTLALASSFDNKATIKIKWTASVDGTQTVRLDDIVIKGTPCNTPTSQATSIGFSSITSNTNTVSWTRGNGTAGVLVLAKSGSAVNSDPVDGTTYTANAAFGSGDQIGTGNYVVYKGSGTSVTVTGLAASTTYHYAVYEYNTNCLNHNATELTGNQATSATATSDYFRSLGTGNWNSASSWQSSPDNTNWGTSSLAPTSSATAITIQTGHTLTINADVSASSITIAGTGTLTFDGAAARAVTVTGDITISAAGGSFITQAAGVFTNTLVVAGNISNAGTFDMSRGGSTLVCDVTFNKNGNQTVSGAGTTTRFNYITVNMGTSNSNVLEISSDAFAAPANFLHTSSGVANLLQNGTIKFSGTYTLTSTLFQPGDYYNIPATAGLWLNNSNVTISAQNDSYDLYGLLRVTAGVFNVGNTGGNSIKFYTGSTITVDGGTVNIASRIHSSPTTNTTTFNLSSGTVNLVTVGTLTGGGSALEFEASGSSFTMSGGTIVFRNDVSTISAVILNASTNSVTGGTFQFGDGSTATLPAAGFILEGTCPFPSLTLTNVLAGGVYPKILLGSNITVNGVITINTNTTVDVSSDGGTTNYDLTITGNFVNAGTFTARNKTVTFSSNSTISGASTTSFNNVTISGTLVGKSSDNFNVGGTWTNNGTYTHNSGTVTFNGTAAQSLAGSSTTAFNSLTINNTSSTGLTLSAPVTIAGTFTLTDGIVYTDATNTITMNSGSSVSGGQASPASWVDGPMKKVGSTDFVFPLGDVSRYARIGISSLSGAETFTAQYIKETPSNTESKQDQGANTLIQVSKAEYWNLSRAGAENAVVTLYWEDADASEVEDCSNLRIAHYDGSDWDNVGAVTTTGSCTGAVSGTIYSNAALTSFSPFTFGTLAVGPLPITLLNFNAYPAGNDVELYWATSAEINNDFFTVEKSADGANFFAVTTINGAGNSNSVLNYSAIDEDPISGDSYYRLKQTDFDGTVSLSETIKVTLNDISKDIYLYPNPISGVQGFNIVFQDDSEPESISIVDVLEKKHQIKSLNKFENNRGYSVLTENLSTGVYFVIISGKGVFVSKTLLVK